MKLKFRGFHLFSLTHILVLILITFFLPIQVTRGNPIPVDENWDTLPIPNNYNGSVYFKQEIINVTFDDSEAHIIAQYSFKNANDSYYDLGILLPFRVTADKPKIHSLLVAGSETEYSWKNSTLPIIEDLGWSSSRFLTIELNVSFNPDEEKLIQIEYSREYMVYNSQMNSEIHYSFWYIIGTARAWNHSIDLAYFSFRVPTTICDQIHWPSYIEDLGQNTNTVTKSGGYYHLTLTYTNWNLDTPVAKKWDFLRVTWRKTKTFWINPELLLFLIPVSVALVILGVILLKRFLS